MPSWDHVARVLSLRDYNTRVVLLGAVLLGVAAGVVGVFMLLRRRSLVGDVIGHAALPGIGLAFLVLEAASPGSGRSMPAMLLGAFVAGLVGVGFMTLIRRFTRVREDAALAIVLSVFFGLGIALFTVIQSIPGGNAAGLNQFLFGQAASMSADSVRLIAAGGVVSLVACGLLFKEFGLLCFDEDFAAAQGWPVLALDLLLMTLVAGVAVIGLQSVGLLLVSALLIIPAAAARFWTNHLGRLAATAAGLGGLSCGLGVLASALFPRLAAGAIIVLCGAAVFVVSLLFGLRGGAVRQWWQHRQLERRIARHDLLRAAYEVVEATVGAQVDAALAPRQAASNGAPPALHSEPADVLTHTPFTPSRLREMRSWPERAVRRLVKRAERDGLLTPAGPDAYRLTAAGSSAARRIVRNHRLWEAYLIRYADIAASHVDHTADLIEHVLEPEIVDELERVLKERSPSRTVPPSPHEIGRAGG